LFFVSILAWLSLSGFAAETKGFTYLHDEVPERPWSIHIVKIDRAASDFQLDTVVAQGSSFGFSALPDQIQHLPAELGRPVAAINGDFYDRESPYQGDPKGLQISRGELLSAPGAWSCFWMDEKSEPHLGIVTSQLAVKWPNGKTTSVGLNERRANSAAVIYTRAIGSSTRTYRGRELVLEPIGDGAKLPLRPGEDYTMRVREVRESGDTPVPAGSLVLSLGPSLARSLPKPTAGDTLGLSTATTPSLKGARTALGGGPALIHEGTPHGESSERRHPRSAIGWNRDFFYFVEVDGRQPNLSIGMTSAEMATYMKKLGCDEALNLDGGGSATVWVLGQVVNSPCEGRERSVANSLILLQKRKQETAAPSAEALAHH